MAYMDGNAVFADGIEELSFAQIEEVGGAILPLLAIAYVGIGLSVGVLALGGGVLVGLRINEAVRLK